MRTVLLAGSLGLATLVGALFAYNSHHKVQQLPREKVLSIAKQLRQQMFMPLVEVACFIKQNARNYTPDQLREYVLGEESPYVKSFKSKLETVFNQFTEEQYQENVEKFYKDDLQIQYHLKKYQQEFDKSMLGVTPQFRQEIVTFLTPQKLLGLTRALLEAKMSRITEKINEKTTSQQMVIVLRAQKEKEKALRSQKLRELGFVGKDDQLAAIFQFAVAKYMKIDPDFQKEYTRILQEYRKTSNDYMDRFCVFPRSPSKEYIGLGHKSS